MAKDPSVSLELDGFEVSISNPNKVYFPEAGITKGELVEYYLAVADGALLGVRNRPMALKRFVDGITGEAFFQKRAPKTVPEFVSTVELAFPSGRTADEVVVRNRAALAWVVNLGCVDLNPHPVRADDLEHPDEIRADLDPGPGVPWADVRSVAMVVRDVFADHGLTAFPKTSGSRGIHIYARIEQRWGFSEVRRAALAMAREVERRAPSISTSKWWKEERHGVFIDYNQNAKDRTVASAYSVRPLPAATVSAPMTWDEVPDAELGDFTLGSMPARYARLGDVGAGIDEAVGSLEQLLDLAARDEALGLGDAPWPPNYVKQPGEPPRVQPSKRRMPWPDGAAPGGRAGDQPQQMPPPPARRADGSVAPTGRRRSSQPLIVISQAKKKADALDGLERWKQRHPRVAKHIADDDVLVDGMRGRSSLWYRVRVNLRHVPEADRPAEEKPDPDYDLSQEWSRG
ncbi:MAG TPA: non-homologous end-joining DNA ligase [Candidatus Limnocylindria bacterium]|jgi:DNA ligase D-like protein (predicted polymerase)|nr:non-homologous end-joining DNA ligase [Candidatus Limnocylindria bacterium]